MNFKQQFFGATTTLSIFAWAAMVLAVGGWVFFAFGWAALCFASELAAFVLGISSCCPLGGIATLCAVLTLGGWLLYGVMMSAS
jgi:hypothetical protein